jgi:hypothetical protein
MTSLEDFLNKNQPAINEYFDPVEGSFNCQNKECNVITYEAFLDADRKRVKWTCSNGHDSAVII